MPDKFFAKEVLCSLSPHGQSTLLYAKPKAQELINFQIAFNWYPDIFGQHNGRK